MALIRGSSIARLGSVGSPHARDARRLAGARATAATSDATSNRPTRRGRGACAAKNDVHKSRSSRPRVDERLAALSHCVAPRIGAAVGAHRARRRSTTTTLVFDSAPRPRRQPRRAPTVALFERTRACKITTTTRRPRSARRSRVAAFRRLDVLTAALDGDDS